MPNLFNHERFDKARQNYYGEANEKRNNKLLEYSENNPKSSTRKTE